MPGTDIPGDDYNVTNVNYADPHICQVLLGTLSRVTSFFLYLLCSVLFQASCTADPACAAYTYVTRPPLVGSCCLKSAVPQPVANPTCTSGVKKAPSAAGGVPLPLLKGDTSVDVRVFVDNTFVEVFIMQVRANF